LIKQIIFLTAFEGFEAM